MPSSTSRTQRTRSRATPCCALLRQHREYVLCKAERCNHTTVWSACSRLRRSSAAIRPDDASSRSRRTIRTLGGKGRGGGGGGRRGGGSAHVSGVRNAPFKCSCRPTSLSLPKLTLRRNTAASDPRPRPTAMLTPAARAHTDGPYSSPSPQLPPRGAARRHRPLSRHPGHHPT